MTEEETVIIPRCPCCGIGILKEIRNDLASCDYCRGVVGRKKDEEANR